MDILLSPVGLLVLLILFVGFARFVLRLKARAIGCIVMAIVALGAVALIVDLFFSM